MSLAPLRVDWRSRVVGAPSPGEALPAEIATPALAWDYGATTEALQPGDDDSVLRVRLSVSRGVVGVAVLSLNYAALLSQEAPVRPEDGKQTLCFAFPRRFGPCRLLLRTYADAGEGQATVLSVESGRLDDLSEREREGLLGPVEHRPAPALPDALAAWAPPHDALFFPISLGNTCEAKFQIARTLQFRRDPQGSELGFRLSMLPPRRAEDLFGWELFDWQGTSLKAVLAYLDRDFHGLFERGDLVPAGGGVIHRNLQTEHMHDFEFFLDHPAAKVTPQIVDEGHPAAQARFEVMAERFRTLLTTPGPYLYVHVCEDIPTEWDVETLVTALKARSPEHRFRLLFVGYEDSDTPWGDYAPTVADKALRPRTWDKPEGRTWEGPDAAWDAALAPYQLAFPDGTPA